jgi:hypothetical protein
MDFSKDHDDHKKQTELPPDFIPLNAEKFDPDVWGPHGWKFFHFVALGYSNNPSDEDKLNYKNFFTIIPKILPCSICSNHYNKNLEKYPITDNVLSNRTNLLIH